jgi:hypothetical protein
MTYINGVYEGNRETIDEFPTRKEARKMLAEYRLSYGPDWVLWMSSRCCNSWKN